jgi:membrane protein DedA with SNARE-associated domain
MAGAALWAGFWCTLAYRFGASANVLPFFWHHLNLVAAIAVPLIIACLAWLYIRHRQPARTP